MLILVSIVSSSLRHTGLFAHSSLLPPACTLPFQESETLVLSGTASGGGTIGSYRVAAQDAALIRTPEYPDDPSHLELQVILSSSHWQPWLDNLNLYEVPGTWIDSTGATGTAYCFSWLDFCGGRRPPCPSGSWTCPSTLPHLLQSVWPGPSPKVKGGSEQTPVIICTDPSVVRVEAQLVWLGTSERADPQAAIDSRGVSPVFTQVADGVWAAPSTVVPGAPNDAAYSLVFWCQGYDADGNLVCQDQPHL